MQRPNFSLDGKVSVITGASRGIGSAVAAALAQSGAAVALLGRDARALAATADALAAAGCRAQYFCADVADVASIEAAFEQVERSLGHIDILINNAGIEQVCASLDVTEALWDRIVGTNLKGAFFAAQAAGRRMPSGGSIVNICSLTSGFRRPVRGVEIRPRRSDSGACHRVGRSRHPCERHWPRLFSNGAH